ncbi:MAG: hypothetical protein H6Q05_1317 [Acidobacteria bacterium]|nr:hypothetical protein [Acidobacteriota bacterium]
MKTQKPEKIDFGKIHKDLYSATSKVKELAVGKATFLTVEGKGEPGGPAFQEAIQKLYTVAYTTKFMLKYEGKLDFAVSRLECLWRIENPDTLPRSEWKWQLLIRIPDAVTSSDLKKAAAEIRRKRELDVAGVVRLRASLRSAPHTRFTSAIREGLPRPNSKPSFACQWDLSQRLKARGLKPCERGLKRLSNG